MTRLGLPSLLADPWDRASPRERTLVVVAILVVVAGLYYGLAWPALTRDIDRTANAYARERATLDYLRSLQAPQAAAPAPVDARAAVEQAFATRGVRAEVTRASGAAVTVALAAVPFDTLVAALDDLSRSAGLRTLEARVTARVEPGTVRADLTLTR